MKQPERHEPTIPFNIEPTFLDPQAWDALTQASDFESYIQNWLVLLCSSIVGTEKGVVILYQPTMSHYSPIAFWPTEEQAKTEGLMQASEIALDQRKGICRHQDDTYSQLAYPIWENNELSGVVTLEVRGLTTTSAPIAMRLLQWGLAGLLLALQNTDYRKENSREAALQSVLEKIALVLENQGFYKAATLLVTHLASQLDCRRVALGFVKGRHYHLIALSHSVTFSEKTQLIRALEAAMAEAGDMGRCLVFPPQKEDEQPLYPAHEQLLNQHGGQTLCTVPISHDRVVLGALVLERETPFSEETVHWCEVVGNMAGSILELKRQNERGLIKHAGISIQQGLYKTFGPRHWFWKLNALFLLSTVIFFSVATGIFRISADAVLEGTIQQAVVAPMDGFIIEAPLRAGHLVKTTDILFKLDEADLRLEEAKWYHQREQYQTQYRHALAQGNRAESRALKAQLAQAEAQLALVQKQLARTIGYAPFDGIIVSGDLSQSLGAPVERGEVLFEVAPLEDYRVVLQVDETDIAEIQEQYSGHLVLTSFTTQSFHIVINKITPISETKEARNYFRVEADLVQTTTLLRPGMKGIGKIEVGERLLIWIWTRNLMNWLRLWLWSWWP